MNENMTQKPGSERGTVKSYVAGFMVSLVFTAIPYWLVAQKVVSGNVLLVTIIGFAVLQMVVQVVFFLHIGRERGPRFNLWFLLATVGAIVVVVGASLWIMGHLHANMEGSDVIQKAAGGEAIAQVGGKDTGACGEIFAHYEVTIKNGVVSPLHTDAHRCDTITFINEDDQVKDIAFGEHPNHVAYAGQLDIITYKGHPETLTLSQAGTYKFHDHLHEATAGDFTVRP